MTGQLYHNIHYYLPRHNIQKHYKRTRVFVLSYMVYPDFSWILIACLIICFILSIPSVCLILTSLCVCLILTLWMSYYQHTPVVYLCLLVSGTKYSLTLLLSLTLFNILFDWNDSHGQVFKLIKYTDLRRLGNEISYHVICGAPLYIQLLITDTVSDEKETNVDVLGALAT